MRHFLLTAALALACTPTEEQTERSQPPSASEPPAVVEAEPRPGAPGREYFLGYVSQTGIEHCPNGSEFEWLDVRSTLGFIPTGGLSLEPWMGKVVLATGEAGARPPSSTDIQPAECPLMQMRSDWTNSPKGIRVDRGKHPGIEYFTVTSVEPLEELAVVRGGEELLVRFTNPLPFALQRVGLVAHYEGCYGKPGSTERSQEGKPLAPGETIDARFPIIAEVEADHDPRKGGLPAKVHLIDSIQLDVEAAADAPTVHVDLDAQVSAFGLDLTCPDTK